MCRVSKDELSDGIAAALIASNTAPANARSVANALTLAEIDGKTTHGLSRAQSYAGQAKSGKVDGHAQPKITKARPAMLAVDAGHGFAYPAFDAMLEALPDLASEMGVALACVNRSHHFGVAGHHVERGAEQGMVSLLFGNTPAAIAPWGGKTPLFGTNPIACSAPIAGRPPVVIDLATSVVARGHVVAAHRRNDAIPQGWALDRRGNPTTDAGEALDGSMMPLGDAKGAGLALMIEILAGTLTGAGFGYEASSFFDADGSPPNTGQIMLMIDPNVMSDNFAERLGDFAQKIEDDGGRLGGSTRMEKRQKAAQEGIAVDSATWQAVLNLGKTPNKNC